MKNNVLVKKIEILSKDAEEALVHITDGMYECAAFCQPCNKSPGDTIEKPVFAFNSLALVITTQQKFYIKRQNNGLGYEILARVNNIKNNCVQVGSILIELDSSLPGDAQVNDCIKFTCGRLDIF